MPSKPRIKKQADREWLRTRDVLDATGITHQILYRYITLGLIEETQTPGARSTNKAGAKSSSKAGSTAQRLFDRRIIQAIRLIQRLNQSGYTLRDIKEIFFNEKRLRNLR